jgi:hypothetical protein
MQNLIVHGIVLSMDQYERARIFVDNATEINNIIEYLKQYNKHTKFPIENGKIDYSGTIFIITILKKHKQFYSDKLMENIGKLISIEVSPRKWNMNGKCGISLDLIKIE